MSNLKTHLMSCRFTAIMNANYEDLNGVQKAKEFISLIYHLPIITLVLWLTL